LAGVFVKLKPPLKISRSATGKEQENIVGFIVSSLFAALQTIPRDSEQRSYTRGVLHSRNFVDDFRNLFGNAQKFGNNI